jgi:hypothetical protein
MYSAELQSQLHMDTTKVYSLLSLEQGQDWAAQEPAWTQTVVAKEHCAGMQETEFQGDLGQMLTGACLETLLCSGSWWEGQLQRFLKCLWSLSFIHIKIFIKGTVPSFSFFLSFTFYSHILVIQRSFIVRFPYIHTMYTVKFTSFTISPYSSTPFLKQLQVSLFYFPICI